MLSIGKLSYLAQLHEKDPPQITESVLDGEAFCANSMTMG